MARIEIPLNPVDPELIDPNYERRREIVERMSVTKPTVSAPIIKIGEVSDKTSFSQPMLRHRDILTRQLTIDLDEERRVATVGLFNALEQFTDPITKIIAHEYGAYHGTRAFGAGLLVDKRNIQKGRPQRTDDIGVARRDIEVMWQHLYFVSDIQPTDCFVFGQNDPLQATISRRYNKELMAPETLLPTFGLGEGVQVSGAPYEIIFANSTTYHESPLAEEDGDRTFFRMVFNHTS